MNGDENLTKDNWSEPKFYVLDVKQTMGEGPDDEVEEWGTLDILS